MLGGWGADLGTSARFTLRLHTQSMALSGPRPAWSSPDTFVRELETHVLLSLRYSFTRRCWVDLVSPGCG